MGKSSGRTNIEFLFGDSLELLPKIMPKVKTGAVFFLDAHSSGPDSGMNGTHVTPLMKELDIILNYELGPSIFILDDVRFWEEDVNWRDVSTTKIVTKFIQHDFGISEAYVKNDRFWIVTK
jgi:hypothetical protein